MPKNKGKGGKKRRRGRNEKEMVGNELIEKDSDQQVLAYARVMKLMGGGRLIAHCFDGKERQCNIRGKLRKRMWINQGDIILLGLRDYQDEKADVIHKYTPEQARLLKAKGQLPETVEFRKEHDEGDIVFEDTDLVPQDRNYDIESSSGEDFDSEEDEDDDEEED